MQNQKNNSILIFAGTRPEIIKTTLVYKKLLAKGFNALFCATFQHKDLSAQFLDFFGITPDFKLNLTTDKPTLANLTAELLTQISEIIAKVKPICVMVQGDTMTTTAAALAAFLYQVPVCHIEAGLRTGDMSAPFPEEFNRRVCTLATTLHFAPTQNAKNNLLAEGIDTNKIIVTGNTVVDALLFAQTKIAQTGFVSLKMHNFIAELKANFKKIAMMTMHRRESFAAGLNALATAILNLAATQKVHDFVIIYPRHPNPATKNFAELLAEKLPQTILLCEPLDYADFIFALSNSDFVITDSGGVLEESAALGKPVVCVREKTERPESLLSPNIFLTGFKPKIIEQAIKNALQKTNQPCKEINNLFGNGNASELIAKTLEQKFMLKSDTQINPATLDINFTPTIQNNPTVAIFGLGYIGLPTATVLAHAGFNVIGIDIDENKIKKILNHEIDFLEGNLQNYFQSALADKSLIIKKTLNSAAEYFIICVPTPLKNNLADMSYVMSCSAPIAQFLKPGNLVIIESTVPVGTTDLFTKNLEILSGLKANQDFFVAYCPERVIPGCMEKELIENDRVIGAEHPQGFLLASKLYQRFCTGNLSFVDSKTAELVKLLENSFRNVQVAFANEVFDIATAFGLDPNLVIKTANRHPRVKILNPGPGVGGHCIAVDPIFITNALVDQCAILKTCIEQNKKRPQSIVEEILQHVKKTPTKVLVLGLAYKPDIGDLRESPALEIAQKLAKNPSIQLSAFDPWINKQEIVNINCNVVNNETIASAIINTDFIVILVAHTSFKELLLNIDLSNKIIIDPTCFLSTLIKLQTKKFGKLQTCSPSTT